MSSREPFAPGAVDNHVRRVALGTVQFGRKYGVANVDGQVSREQAAAILAYAATRGLDTLDTAIAYGDSEQRLGEIGVDQWRVISKLPRLPMEARDVERWAIDHLEGALRRLRIPACYALMVHHAPDLGGSHGRSLYRALSRLKREGLVEKIGVSVYGPEDLEHLVERFSLDIVQAPFNVIDRRLWSSGWLQRLVSSGTEVHVRSVFLQGLLVMDASKRPEKFNRWRRLLDSWDAWLREQRVNPVHACLAFALSLPAISRVVVGVDSLAQLREVLDFSAEGPAVPPASVMSDDADLINPSHWDIL